MKTMKKTMLTLSLSMLVAAVLAQSPTPTVEVTPTPSPTPIQLVAEPVAVPAIVKQPVRIELDLTAAQAMSMMGAVAGTHLFLMPDGMSLLYLRNVAISPPTKDGIIHLSLLAQPEE
jgi:hypothetical protein